MVEKPSSESTDMDHIEPAKRPSSDDNPDDQRDREVLDIALAIALDELKESRKVYDSARSRIGFIFGTVMSALAFLVGTAVRSLDHKSFEIEFLTLALLFTVLFGAAAIIGLWPRESRLYLRGQGIRDEFFRGNSEDVKPEYAYPTMRVVWQLIRDADFATERNLAVVDDYFQHAITAMILFGTLSISFWALLVAYAAPTP